MEFGLFCSAQADSNAFGPETGQGFASQGFTGQGFRDYLDFNVEAEALGFRSSFLVEHHFTGRNQVSSTLMLLTALAMRTSRLRLGSAVMVLPWHNPVLLAEQAATLDLISGGRFDFGIGKGYRHSEFNGFQIAPEEAQARFDEGVEVMVRAFTTRKRFSHHGRFWHFEDIVVEPPPAQQPRPPFWVAAGSEPSIRRAAAQGFNLILDQYASAKTLGERIGLYRTERRQRGLTFDPMQVVVARQLYVAKDEADKQAALTRQAAYTKRTVDVSRKPESQDAAKGGSQKVRMCSLMPTRRAAPRRMRSTARRTRSPPCSRICAGRECITFFWSCPVASRNCAVSPARSCRPLRAACRPRRNRAVPR
jgi:alkanesulfonate monooxygenase SsuD/methylene tetrahydromethanopterin reductase-like flavin-dependent oxidoreductase (luciferase family)